MAANKAKSFFISGAPVSVTDPVTRADDDTPETRMDDLILDFAMAQKVPFSCAQTVSYLTTFVTYQAALTDPAAMTRLKNNVRQKPHRFATKTSKRRPVPPLKSAGTGFYLYNHEAVEAAKQQEDNSIAARRAQIRAKNRMDFSQAGGKTVDLVFPMGLHEHFKLYRGNIVTIAGTTDAGKTTLAMELVAKALDNPAFTGITYINCEMDPDECLDRMREFEKTHGLPPETLEHKVDWLHPEVMDALDEAAMEELALSIEPGHLTIIEYVEISDQHYRIAGVLRKLHRYVGKGILVVLQQKPADKEYGFGGISTLALARLGISLDWDEEANQGVLRFTKVKKPAKKGGRPKSLEILYSLNEDATQLLHQATRFRQRQTKASGGVVDGKPLLAPLKIDGRRQSPPEDEEKLVPKVVRAVTGK